MKRFVITLGVIILLALVCTGLVVWFVSALQPADSAGQTRTVEISEGNSVGQIARQLDQTGIIRSAFAFRIYVLLEGMNGSLQAGLYELDSADGTADIIRELATGDISDREVTVKVIEGSTNAEISEKLAQAITASQSWPAAFLEAVSSSDLLEDDYPFLKGRPAGGSLEGFLFPDTYRFFKDANPEAVVQKMLNNFNSRVPAEVRGQAVGEDRTFYDVLIMASILEKELKTTGDRRLAADLFWRRLAANMPLQSDATVNYITGHSALQPSLDDLAVDSPYNTYQHTGLPPTPICNPGRAAIDAALTPTANDYWYYLTDQSGTAHFSRSYAEHVQNKAKYLP